MGQSFSTNIGLSALPEYEQAKDPAAYAEFLRIRNALQVLQGAIDGLGGAGGAVVTHSGGNFIVGQPIIAANNAGDTISVSSVETAGYVLTSAGPGTTPIWAPASLSAIADKLILANISGGPAAPIGNSLSNLIDSILGNTQGQLITRNSGSWTVLGPSTGGRVLTEHGTGANLSWDAPVANPNFSVYRNTPQTLGSNAFTQLAFDTTEYDVGGYWSINTYTPLKAGKYHFSWGVNITNSPVSVLSTINKNGSRYKDGSYTAGGGGQAGSVGSSLVQMNGTTDTVSISVYTNVTAGITNTGIFSTYFNGFWTGP